MIGTTKKSDENERAPLSEDEILRRMLSVCPLLERGISSGGAKVAIALFIDNKLIKTAESLEQAKQLAELYILDKPEVRIERTATPAPV